jgi:hypothetical protein
MQKICKKIAEKSLKNSKNNTKNHIKNDRKTPFFIWFLYYLGENYGFIAKLDRDI